MKTTKKILNVSNYHLYWKGNYQGLFVNMEQVMNYINNSLPYFSGSINDFKIISTIN